MPSTDLQNATIGKKHTSKAAERRDSWSRSWDDKSARVHTREHRRGRPPVRGDMWTLPPQVSPIRWKSPPITQRQLRRILGACRGTKQSGSLVAFQRAEIHREPESLGLLAIEKNASLPPQSTRVRNPPAHQFFPIHPSKTKSTNLISYFFESFLARLIWKRSVGPSGF